MNPSLVPFGQTIRLLPECRTSASRLAQFVPKSCDKLLTICFDPPLRPESRPIRHRSDT